MTSDEGALGSAGLVAAARRRLEEVRQAYPARLLVAGGTCGEAVGADGVAAQLRTVVAARRLPVAVIETGCTGMCHAAVQVTLQRSHFPDVTWNGVTADQTPALAAFVAGEAASGLPSPTFAWTDEVPIDREIPGLLPLPFLTGQRRLLLAGLGRVAPTDADEALARGIYDGVARALALPPEAVIAVIEESGLRGRGGAYFPTAGKYAAARARPGPRFLVVNAEEGEPGVFKDRHLLEGDPHRLVAGLLIAAHALSASRVFVYVNGQARLAERRLTAALAAARARGLIGTALGGNPCVVEVRLGGGGYVLGEETALLESIEGRRPLPRIRPPYSAEVGLWGRPTVIQNVETLANLPLIFALGAAAFAGIGTARCPGTKLIAITGDVARPGLVEVPTGTPLGQVLGDLAGGVPGGRRLQAILMGGPSGQLVPPARLDTPLEPGQPAVPLGSGNLTVLDETRDLLAVARRLMHFNAAESCGKCTPCREGVSRMSVLLDRLGTDAERPGDRADLAELGDIAASAALCGLGQMAPGPVRSLLAHFDVPGLSVNAGR